MRRWPFKSTAAGGGRLVSHSQCLQQRPLLPIGLIGYGAIGSEVAAYLSRKGNNIPAQITAILVKHPRDRPADLPPGVLFTADPASFFAADWSLGVEAAGQPAVTTYGEQCLLKGRDFLVTSVGAFTSDSLLLKLQEVAGSSGARLLLASGALPAVDWMHAASLAGGGKVTIRQIKPPMAWVGSRYDPNTGHVAPDTHDFHNLQSTTLVFEGSARQAAALYPKNANVSAMLALATSGLDETMVQLVADPSGRFSTELEYSGTAGSLQLQVEGKPSPQNPRTSVIVPLSVLRSIRNLCASSVYGI